MFSLLPRYFWFVCLSSSGSSSFYLFFFFNDTATTEIYTLSLTRRSSDLHHRATSRGLPESWRAIGCTCRVSDRKSTRLNSSHSQISYAVFCLKKKKRTSERHRQRHILLRNTLYFYFEPHITRVNLVRVRS